MSWLEVEWECKEQSGRDGLFWRSSARLQSRNLEPVATDLHSGAKRDVKQVASRVVLFPPNFRVMKRGPSFLIGSAVDLAHS